ETTRPLIDRLGHRLTVSLPQEPLWLEGDSVRLSEVLTNLLNNAAKFTPEGGHLALTVDSSGDDINIRVSDTGIGIPADTLPHVFDLFTQGDRSLDRSRGGLGVGLSLVRGIVEMHGGSVRAFSSGRDQGSEFVVRLRRACEPKPREQ